MRKLIALLLPLLLTAPASQALERVVITTNLGAMTFELDDEKAPKTVANFLQYVDEGFYDGTIFHRVIDGFMAQGGGFTADYERKQTHAPIMNEADNGLRNRLGTIAMARTGDPHSATSQFFINVNNNASLDFREKRPRAWGYAVFGQLVDGLDVLGKIKSVPTGAAGPFRSDVPRETIIIESIRRVAAE